MTARLPMHPFAGATLLLVLGLASCGDENGQGGGGPALDPLAMPRLQIAAARDHATTAVFAQTRGLFLRGGIAPQMQLQADAGAAAGALSAQRADAALLPVDLLTGLADVSVIAVVGHAADGTAIVLVGRDVERRASSYQGVAAALLAAAATLRSQPDDAAMLRALNVPGDPSRVASDEDQDALLDADSGLRAQLGDVPVATDVLRGARAAAARLQ